jgi:cbb3-type cytochrome oxidase maturation protein
MNALIYLIPIALLLGLAGLGAFLWSLKSGQYDDLDGAAERILFDDEEDEAAGGRASPGPGRRGQRE